jgi:hypothetical protein
MSNENLFYYGLFSNVIFIIGLGISLFGTPTVYPFNHTLGFVAFVLGILIMIKSRAMRFNYKMQSGTIIHRGDW